MKKFDTVDPSNLHDSNAAINWHDGSMVNKTQDTWIHYGAEKMWTRDVNWGVSPNAKLHEWHSCSMGGNNGKSHTANYEQNVSGWGRYIPMEFVHGFSIDAKQSSKDGHSLFLLNAGIEFRTEDGTYYRWGSVDQPRQGHTNQFTGVYMFSSSDREEMSKNGARFHRFICRLSTNGGVGTRDTNVKLGNFRLLYSGTGCENARWVLPNLRRIGDYLNPDILPM